MYHIVRYTELYHKQWDSFLNICKKNHFMFKRDYIEYHKDRFIDHSLLCIDENDDIVSLFPANQINNTVISHEGLTFGGLLYSNKLSTKNVIEIMELIVNYYKLLNIDTIIYKAIPWIYSKMAAEEDEYAIYSLGAKLYRRDVSTAILNRNQLRLSKGKKWAINKASKNGIKIHFKNEYDEYWELLTNVLMLKYQKNPVHSLSEISYLKSLFPDNIKLLVAVFENNIIAGSVIYFNENVVHTQYMANSENGRKMGALDLVISWIIDNYIDHRIIDFGISTENDGYYLNEGLIAQKEGFGGGAILFNHYRLDL